MFETLQEDKLKIVRHICFQRNIQTTQQNKNEEILIQEKSKITIK